MKTAGKPLLAVALIALAALAAPAQDELTGKQERARLKFEELHARMQKLEILLADSEPEESRVLRLGNRFIQESRIHEDLAAVQTLLDEQKWDQALTEMDRVRGELTQLMDLLLNRDTDLQEILEQIEEWERFKERLDALIEDQQAEKDAAARTEALEQHLRDLEQARQQVERIIAEQESLREDANRAGLAAAPESAREMASRQGELEQGTGDLAAALEEIEREAAELSDPEAGAQPGAQGEGGAPQAGAGSCSGAAASAAGSMGRSRQKLQQNRPESSLQDQDRALGELGGLRDRLEEMSEEARRELLELPFEQQLQAQETTRIDTDALAREMEQARSEDRSGEPTGAPGTENVQQAVPKQKAAAGMLKERKPGAAKQKQQDAKEELEAAQRKLEEALAQLRQQLQDEVLRSLEERFGAMLARQKELSADTRAVERLRGETLAAGGGLPASLASRVEEIAGGEAELASEAGSALQLLSEEGTTAAFPAMVEILKADLEHVAGRLGRHQTGLVTQNTQAEIEENLRILIDSLRRQIEENEAEGEAQPSDSQPPLVPMSAELKLIQALQKRVLARTRSYDTEVPAQLRVTEEGREEALEISRKQGQVEELTRKMAEKLNKDGGSGGGR